MKKFCVVLVLALVAHVSLGMKLRYSESSDSSEEFEDRYGWNRPNHHSHNSGQWQFHNEPQQPATTPATSGSTNRQSAAIQACIRSCPVTSEYNPICGSDNQTYSNVGRLICAQNCGVVVSQKRSSPCPVTTPAPTSN